LHLTEIGVQPPTINATVTALRFFFKVTLDRPETFSDGFGLTQLEAQAWKLPMITTRFCGEVVDQAAKPTRTRLTRETNGKLCNVISYKLNETGTLAVTFHGSGIT
jgi:hypothetical protein